MQENPNQNFENGIDASSIEMTDQSGFRQQTANLLASREGAETQANREASLLLQDGLKDLNGPNELTGILELMKAAQLKPELIQDGRLFSYLQSIVGDTPNPHPEEAHFNQAEAGDMSAQPEQVNMQADAPQSNVEAENKDSTPQETQRVEAADQSMQMIQKGLSAIAAGDKLTGIISLMQAAQSYPSIIGDVRFQTALQSALSYNQNKNKGIETADANGLPSMTMPGAEIVGASLPV